VSAELEIPDAALAAAIRAVDPEATDEEIATEIAERDGEARAAFAAAGPHIVAAELRRLAEVLLGEEDAHRMWRALGRRAAELEAQS
jgi:t-SNARE complex subunit (syntaxin)